MIRALILTPTRELAAQIGDNCALYARHLPLRHRVIFWWGKARCTGLRFEARCGYSHCHTRPSSLICTSRALSTLIMWSFLFLMRPIECWIWGLFTIFTERCSSCFPNSVRTFFFCNNAIIYRQLANWFLNDPITVEVDQQSSTVDRITQQVMFVAKSNKRKLLVRILQNKEIESTIVFTRTKHGANRVVKELIKGEITAAAIHGNKSQNARTRALEGFKNQSIRVLVATDIASRGIDVDGVSHVFNYDLAQYFRILRPSNRSYRKSGKSGVAIAFCDESETF